MIKPKYKIGDILYCCWGEMHDDNFFNINVFIMKIIKYEIHKFYIKYECFCSRRGIPHNIIYQYSDGSLRYQYCNDYCHETLDFISDNFSDINKKIVEFNVRNEMACLERLGDVDETTEDIIMTSYRKGDFRND